MKTSTEILRASVFQDDSLYRLLFANAADGIWLVDAEGRILDVNERSCLDLGYRVEELRGMHVEDIDLDWSAERLAPVIEKQLETGESVLVDGRQRRKDGSIMPVEVSAQMIEYQGQPFFISTIRDVSSRVEALEELERKKSLLERARRLESLGLLAGGMAHDINNLLTPILIEVELLANGATKVTDAVKAISKSALRARDLTQQLLLFSRKQVFQPRSHDLGSIVQSFETTMRRLIREDIEIRYELQKCPVCVDEVQVSQAMLNLVVNAQDAMPDGGRITIRTKDNVLVSQQRMTPTGVLLPGRYAMLQVIDEGTGLPPEVRPHLLEPFFSTKRAGEGTGLGLATVQAVAEQHAGAVEFESEAQQGTTFSLYLPRHDEEPNDATERSTSRPAMEKDIKILLVEDDAAVLDVVRRSLQLIECEVLAVSSGVEALELVAGEDHIDLLLSDVIMPEMKGPTLATHLRRRWPSIGVLFMSGYTAEELKPHEISSLNAHFIAKPFTPDELVRMVHIALR